MTAEDSEVNNRQGYIESKWTIGTEVKITKADNTVNKVIKGVRIASEDNTHMGNGQMTDV